MNGSVRWSNRALVLLGTAAGIAAGVLLAGPDPPATRSPVTPGPDLSLFKSSAPESNTSPRRIAYPGLLTHSLLPSVTSSSKQVKAKKVTAAPPPPPIESRVRITGVFQCSDPRKSRVVVVRLADGKQEIYKAGDRIEGIEIISIDEVVKLRYAGQVYRVRFVSDSSGNKGRWEVKPLAQAGEGRQ